jgi:DNA polymerase V
MKALDELNGRCGRDTIGFVAAGLARPWKLRREFVSQRYTTRWDELLGV